MLADENITSETVNLLKKQVILVTEFHVGLVIEKFWNWAEQKAEVL